MKNKNIKGVAQFGVLTIAAMGLASVSAGFSPWDQNQVFATDAIQIQASNEITLPEEEARQGAVELYTTIRRLEITPEYEKASKLFKAYDCQYYDEVNPYNWSRCDKATTEEDVRNALLEVVAEEQKDEVASLPNVGWDTMAHYLPMYEDWREVYNGVMDTYYMVRVWSATDIGVAVGITHELTVSNLTKIMQRTGSIYSLGDKYRSLDMFWDGLLALRADTWTGKISRLQSELEHKPWMNLVRAVYDLERNIGTSSEKYYSDALSDALVQFAGDTYYLSAVRKLEVARNLSDYGQAKVLFDELNMVCGQSSICFTTIRENGYSEKALGAKYNNLVTLTEILHPGVMNELFNYRLMLANLPDENVDNGVPTAPNTGSLKDNDSAGMIVSISIVAAGTIAIVIGGAVMVWLYSPRLRKSCLLNKK